MNIQPRCSELVKVFVGLKTEAPEGLVKDLKVHEAKVDSVKNLVERCVSNYTMGSGVADFFAYVIFRVIDAVKAFFDQSDWQLAEAAWLNLLAEQHPMPLTSSRIQVKRLLNDSLEALVDSNVVAKNMDIEKRITELGLRFNLLFPAQSPIKKLDSEKSKKLVGEHEHPKASSPVDANKKEEADVKVATDLQKREAVVKLFNNTLTNSKIKFRERFGKEFYQSALARTQEITWERLTDQNNHVSGKINDLCVAIDLELDKLDKNTIDSNFEEESNDINDFYFYESLKHLEKISKRLELNGLKLKEGKKIQNPQYFHSTKTSTILGILQDGFVPVNQNDAFKGAAVSTKPEIAEDEDFIFAFDGPSIERRSDLLNGYLTADAYWAGFSKPIPLKNNVAYLIVKDESQVKAGREILRKAGYYVPVVTLQEALLEHQIRESLRGKAVIPREWNAMTKVDNVMAVHFKMRGQIAVPVIDPVSVLREKVQAFNTKLALARALKTPAKAKAAVSVAPAPAVTTVPARPLLSGEGESKVQMDVAFCDRS